MLSGLELCKLLGIYTYVCHSERSFDRIIKYGNERGSSPLDFYRIWVGNKENGEPLISTTFKNSVTMSLWTYTFTYVYIYKYVGFNAVK